MAQAYEQTKGTDEAKNAQIVQTIDAVIGQLQSFQDMSSNGYLFASPEAHFDVVEGKVSGEQWVPWYTMHKLIAGFVDVCVPLPSPEGVPASNGAVAPGTQEVPASIEGVPTGTDSTGGGIAAPGAANDATAPPSSTEAASPAGDGSNTTTLEASDASSGCTCRTGTAWREPHPRAWLFLLGLAALHRRRVAVRAAARRGQRAAGALTREASGCGVARWRPGCRSSAFRRRSS